MGGEHERRDSGVRLIRSTTMKCRIDPRVVNPLFDAGGARGEPIYVRREAEGVIEVLDDFSLRKHPADALHRSPAAAPRFAAPLFIRWDLGYACNFRCRHCYSDCGSQGETGLPTADVKRLIDLFHEYKVQMVQILGGEPLVRPDIDEVVCYAAAKPFLFCINTNGYLLDQERIDRYQAAGLRHVQISLHGLEGPHEALTEVRGSFARAVAAIADLQRAGINVSISCLVSDLNAESLFDFLSFLGVRGVRNIQLLSPLNEGRAASNSLALNPAARRGLKDRLIEFKNTHREVNLDLPGFDVDVIDGLVNVCGSNGAYEFFFGCMGGVSGLRVNPRGDACICVGSCDRPLANLLTASLPEVMQKAYSWRKAHPPRMCERCESYLRDCQGACYLRCGGGW